jgi:hypothetical protein
MTSPSPLTPLELNSFTDAASHALYDPEALKHLRPHHDADDEAIVTTEPERGNLLTYFNGGDGEARFSLLIGGGLPDNFKAIAIAEKRDLLLRVPSGTLVASGVEYINDPQHLAKANRARIPAGNYLVDWHCLSWDGEEQDRLLKQEFGWIHTAELFSAIGCIYVGLFSLLGIIYGVAALSKSWPLAWAGLFFVPLAALIATRVAIRMKQPVDYHQRRDAIRSQFPEEIFVLRRLPDGADLGKYKGGSIDVTASLGAPGGR